MSEFNQGAAYARDLILANIIGLQNEARYRQGTEGYNALQELLEHCTETYGDMCQPFKG